MRFAYFFFLFLHVPFLPLSSDVTYAQSVLTRSLYTAHWAHICMYLYSNRHTLTLCPSPTQPTPPSRAPINGNPVPFCERQEESRWPTFLKKKKGRGGRGMGWHERSGTLRFVCVSVCVYVYKKEIRG